MGVQQRKIRPMNSDAMRAPILRPWCSDDKPMTPERILAICQSKGWFTVNRYLYRAKTLRKMLFRMVDNGLLRPAGRSGDDLVFKLPKPSVDAKEAQG